MESFIEICSPDVINSFVDNFDYQTIRDDLIKNVIASDIYFDKFHFYEIKKNEYTSVIKNLECYLAISNHLLNRSIHPIVLENMFSPLANNLELTYKYSNFNIYLEKNISIEDSVKLKKNCAVGASSKIEKKCFIVDSVIGKNVTIGSNTIIKNSIIFADCIIKSNCVIENSVICYKNTIESDTVIKNCFSESNLTIPTDEYKFSRITKDQDSEAGNEIAFVNHADFELNNLDDRDLLFLIDKQNHESFEGDGEDEFSSSEKDEDDDSIELSNKYT